MATKTKKKPRGRPFKPGQSGNPGGRPRGLTEFRLSVREHSPEALRRLVAIMRGRKADPLASARVRAIREIFDRGWGKPVQELQVLGTMAGLDVGKDVPPKDRMEIARRVAFLLRAGDERVEKARAGKPARRQRLSL